MTAASCACGAIRVTGGAYSSYLGHVCRTVEPDCTCADHAEALRERDQFRADLVRVTEQHDALREALQQLRMCPSANRCRTCAMVVRAVLAADRQREERK